MVLEKSCGAVVYRKKGGRYFFLLLKHASGLHWSLAKGHAEEGETEEQTARREVFEETGLDVTLKEGFVYRLTYCPRAGRSKDVVFFLGKAHRSKLFLQEKEILHGVWLELEDILMLCSHASTKTVLIAAHHWLINRPPKELTPLMPIAPENS